MPVETSFASQVFIIGTYLSSLAALFFLFQRHIFGMRLLAYEPRYRVPWGISVALLALLFPLLGIVSALLQVDSPKSPQTVVEQHTPEIVEEVEAAVSDGANSDDANDGNHSNFVINALVSTTLMLLFVVAIALLLRSTVNASSSDLGVPQNKEEWMHGAKAGIVAALAAILPVFIIQLILILVLEPENEHPLIEELKQTHTPAMMLMSLLMVVVAAPICEEFTFRLLFQGWLEKFEDELMGFTATERPQPVDVEGDNALSEEDEVTSDPLDDEDEEPDVIPLPLAPQSMELPREGLLPGVPHGWLPILSSGTIFGIAHLGHGVSPVPLVLFGIVLGYLYQRTHRLVAPIVAHAVFNSYSMILLWLSLG
jgi:membrane protease YdiL (CAAX protease family)